MGRITDAIAHAWNAFTNKDPPKSAMRYNGFSISDKPDRVTLTRGNERTLLNSIYNRIAMDVASIDFSHIRSDASGMYLSDVQSGLNRCLKIEANIDQSNRAFIQDLVLSMFDEGTVAVCPTDLGLSPSETTSLDIKALRVGKIKSWRPEHIDVDLYNQKTGNHETVTFPKRMVAIIDNPMYAIMNAPNSTMKRLVHKLNLLDAIDDKVGASKLDLIIQLPYSLKGDAKKAAAEQRRKDIEMQITESKLGIAYIDSTEHITQLNRPLENNLLKQIEFLTKQLYSQLGITEEILSGTANEDTLNNYDSRIIEPIAAAIAKEFTRKFLSKTAITQGQRIGYFRDPFKLIPLTKLAEVVDKLTRNEIMSSNEVRQKLGMRPSDDPKADELRNKNISAPPEAAAGMQQPPPGPPMIDGEPAVEVAEVNGPEDILDAPSSAFQT